MCPVQCVTYVSGRSTREYAFLLTFPVPGSPSKNHFANHLPKPREGDAAALFRNRQRRAETVGSGSASIEALDCWHSEIERAGPLDFE
jgi:hypothetical protein